MYFFGVVVDYFKRVNITQSKANLTYDFSVACPMLQVVGVRRTPAIKSEKLELLSRADAALA